MKECSYESIIITQPHTVDSIRYLPEVRSSKSLLISIECTVVSASQIHLSTGEKEGRGLGDGRGRDSLGQKGHEVARGGGVRAQWRTHHKACSMSPTFVPVVGPICPQTGSNGLSKHYVT